MAHFAQIKDGMVIQVVVVSNENTSNGEGTESESIGQVFLDGLIGGGVDEWVQTSYNSKIRKQFASVGDQYDEDKDVFIRPKPFDSWKLNDSNEWEAPVSKPTQTTEKGSYWDESNLEWITVSD